MKATKRGDTTVHSIEVEISDSELSRMIIEIRTTQLDITSELSQLLEHLQIEMRKKIR